MKRLLYLATAVAFLFTSCTKDDPATGVNIDEAFTSMATIKGYAYVNVNSSSTTVEQVVPAGTKLVFTIENEQYGLGTAERPAKGSYVKTTEVGENGAFEIELPAREDGEAVTVNITGDPIVIDIDMDGVVKKTSFYN